MVFNKVRAIGLAAALSLLPAVAGAEVSEARVSQQFGINYLPLIVAKNQGLIEKHAKAAGIDNLKVTWSQLSGGAAMNEALLSGSLDFAAAGIAPLLTIWDKTVGNAEVKAVVALDALPLYLNTSNPKIASIKDFTEKDRIAVPAVKVSIQSVVLQIAAEKAFGQYDKLDPLTVSLKHPDATAALLSGSTEVTAHFTNPPFAFQQLDSPNIHRVLSSTEVLDGPATLNVVYATAKFRQQNPKVYGAVIKALKEADDFIVANRAEAARIYVAEEKSNLPPEYIEKILNNPEVRYGLTPLNTHKIADFMARIGSLKNKPASWKDYFFPDLHDQTGS